MLPAVHGLTSSSRALRKEKVSRSDVSRAERIRLLRYLIEPVTVFGT